MKKTLSEELRAAYLFLRRGAITQHTFWDIVDGIAREYGLQDTQNQLRQMGLW